MAPGAIIEPPSGGTALPSPPRTPGISKKRNISDAEADNAPAVKRVRIQSSPDSQSSPKEEKNPTLVREEIRYAIRMRDEGDSEAYDNIKRLFDSNTTPEDKPTSASLHEYLVGLNSNATLLKKSCSDLVHAVLDTPWLLYNDHSINAYMRFLGGLACAQSGYISAIFRMLVNNFAHLSTSAGETQHRSLGERLKNHARIHSTLKYLLQLVPSARGSLLSAMSSSFPHESDSKKAHVEFVRNLLRVTEYVPELKTEISNLVIERLIKIDVHVQVDVEELAEEVGDLLPHSQTMSNYNQSTLGFGSANADASDSGSDVEDDEDLEDELDEEELRERELRSAILKMDAILDTLFTLYSPTFSKGPSKDSEALYEQLLSEFQKTILPTYRSRHTQFLIFHFAQFSQDRTLQFIDLCISILKDNTRSAVLRSSAAAYIGSFVARGAKISTDVVAYTFDALIQYFEKLRRDHEPTCYGPDLYRFGPYYATAQALIYIFCFRWRDLLAEPMDFDEEDEDEFDPRDLTWLPGIRDVFTQNFQSKLNPLKICAPEVVEEFARIAHHLSFLYIYQILDSNKRLRLSQYSSVTTNFQARETSLSVKRGERIHQMDAYFPFDPYHLPRSKQWLIGDYNEWKGVPGLADPTEHAGDETSDDEQLPSSSTPREENVEVDSLTTEADE